MPKKMPKNRSANSCVGKCGTVCELEDSPAVEVMPESRVPTRSETKSLILRNMVQRMTLAVLAGYDVTLRVVTPTCEANIPWSHRPVFLTDDDGTGMLVTALAVFDVEVIEECVLLGMPEV